MMSATADRSKLSKFAEIFRPAEKPAPRHWRFSERSVAVRLFITCWIVFALHFATNTVREIYPALTLGDDFSFDVSAYKDLHPDLFELPGRGAFINNNPGASIIGSVPYAIARPVVERAVERVQRARSAAPRQAEAVEYKTIYPMAQEFHRRARARGIDVKLGMAAAIMQAFAMAPLSALGVVVMFGVLVRLTASVKTSLLLALLYAFATPILYRTAQLNQNVLIAHFAFFSFVALWRPGADLSWPNRPRYFLAGLLAGWTVVLDYSGLVAVLALGAYALARRASLSTALKRPGDLWLFAAGVALCGAVLMAYQWSCFGNPFLPAQSYMPPATYTNHGYRGFGLPRLDLLWETAFGLRFGLFTSAPVLLLALYARGWLRGPRRLFGRDELGCVAGFVVAFFLFCSANQYGWMQFNTGVRHIVPVVPFLFLLTAQVLLHMPRALAIALGVGATYWSWCLAMYRDVEQGRGIVEAFLHVSTQGPRLPWMSTLQQMGYLSSDALLLLLLLIVAGVLWAVWNVGGRPAMRVHHPQSPTVEPHGL